MNSNSAPHPSPGTQRGAVLVVALVTLLVMTLLGVGATRVSSLEEKMAGNARNRNLAFQAADSALRAAENWLKAQATAPPPSDFQCEATPTRPGFYRGNCAWPTNCLGTNTLWDTLECDRAWNDSTRVVAFSGTLANVGTAPSYVIEEIARLPVSGLEQGTTGDESVVYRITARGYGGTPDAVAIVQSTFKK